MLESYTLKQHLEQVRQELAHSLYQHDAACRVIARLIKERDQAKSELASAYSKTGVATGSSAAASGSEEAAAAMDVDASAPGINAAIQAKMKETCDTLSAVRKQKSRDANKKVASRQAIQSFAQKSSGSPHSTAKPGVLCVDISPADSNLLLTGGVDGNAVLFNHATGKIIETLQAHRKKVTDVHFHPTDPKIVFTASADHTAIIWTNTKGRFVPQSVLKHKNDVVGLTIHPSGAYVVTASADATWAFYDVQTGALKRSVPPPDTDAGYTRVAFHPDGLILGTGTSDSVVRIFDVRAQRNEFSFRGHTGSVTGLSFSENGFYLSTADQNAVVKVWDLRKLEKVHSLDVGSGSCHNVSFDGSGLYAAVAAARDVRILSVSRKQCEVIHTLTGHTGDVTDAKFAPDAAFVVSTSMDRTVRVYQPAAA